MSDEDTEETKPKKKSSGRLYAILAGVFAVLSIAFTAMFFLSGSGENLRAIADGQRLIIDAKTGEVSGNPYNNPGGIKDDDATNSPEIPESSSPGFDVGPPVGEEAVPQEESPSSDAESVNEAPSKASLVGNDDEASDTIRVEPPSAASLSPIDKELLEKSDYGVLPVTSVTDSPFSRYRRPYTVSGDAPKVALIVTEIGNRKNVTEQAFALPVNTSFAFSPYSANITSWMESARNTGHEAWLMLPAQTDDFPATDPGPLALLNGLKAEQRAPLLYRNMATSAGYAGVMLMPGESFSNSTTQFEWLLNETKSRGLALLLPAKPSVAAIAEKLSDKRLGAVHLSADEDLSPNAIRAQLAALTQHAKDNGCAIGRIRAQALSIAMAQEWVDSLVREKVAFVPVSACVDTE